MSGEAWTFAGIVVVQVAGVAAVWLKMHKTDGKVDAATATAEQARDYSKPTGNGFAPSVLASLEELKREVRSVRREASTDRLVMSTHLADHARVGLYVPRQHVDASPCCAHETDG